MSANKIMTITPAWRLEITVRNPYLTGDDDERTIVLHLVADDLNQLKTMIDGALGRVA